MGNVPGNQDSRMAVFEDAYTQRMESRLSVRVRGVAGVGPARVDRSAAEWARTSICLIAVDSV